MHIDLLSRLDSAAHLVRIVGHSLPENLVNGVDYRAALTGLADALQRVCDELVAGGVAG
jgi:hypothetical protein